MGIGFIIASSHPLGPLENDILGAFPEAHLADGWQVVVAFDNGEEMISGELAHLRGETARTVGEQDFRLAEASWVEQHLTRCWIAGRVFEADAEVEVAERNPG